MFLSVYIRPEIFGYAGTFFLSVRFIPQLAKAWDHSGFSQKKKYNDIAYNLISSSFESEMSLRKLESRSISIWFFIFEGLTCVCFSIYAIMIHAYPMLLANMISFIFCVILCLLDSRKLPIPTEMADEYSNHSSNYGDESIDYGERSIKYGEESVNNSDSSICYSKSHEVGV